MGILESLLTKTRKELNQVYPIAGRGSSRIVYDLGDSVFKLPIGLKGIAQHRQEVNIYKERSDIEWLCPILEYNDYGLIMKKGIVLTKYKQIPMEHRLEIAQFRKLLKDYLYTFIYHHNPLNFIQRRISGDRMSEIVNKPFYDELESLIHNYEMIYADVLESRSWCFIAGKFYLFDFGYTETVYKECYKWR